MLNENNCSHSLYIFTILKSKFIHYEKDRCDKCDTITQNWVVLLLNFSWSRNKHRNERRHSQNLFMCYTFYILCVFLYVHMLIFQNIWLICFYVYILIMCLYTIYFYVHMFICLYSRICLTLTFILTFSYVSELKTLLFQKKRKLFCKSLIWTLLFIILTHCGKNQE